MSITDLETLWFKTHDGAERCCPHYAPFGGYLRTCKRRDCPRCGRVWALSWESLLRLNLQHYGAEVALVTVTAPGADLLPWDCPREHKHAGEKGCQVVTHAADEWAERARLMWPKLRDAARKASLRAGWKPNLIVRTWEPQKRGVPHLHVVLGLGSQPERIAARRFVDELARLAPDYGFGFVDRKVTPISAREASSYLAGYLLGRSGRKETIRANIADPRMPRSLMWLTPRLTSATLATMRRLRYARWYFAALRGRCAIYPRLKGTAIVEVAKLATLLEPLRARPPNETEDGRFRRHFLNLRTMRRFAEVAA